MAVLYRDLGDLAAAEDAAQEAATIALSSWLDDGVPDRPAAWITTVARRKAVDRIRRERTGRDKSALLARLEEPLADADAPATDDQLALFFGCCHPALSVEAQIALTLRSVGGLTTAEIARGFLVSEPTMAQRIVRAKRKIASAAIPFRVPDTAEMLDRLGVVHHVLHLIFNEAAYPHGGDDTARIDMAVEAIRLAELLVDLAPEQAESRALLALFLLVHSRADARTASPDGVPVLLPDQDRSRWDHESIRRALGILDQAIAKGPPGPFQIEAAIQALHVEAPTSADTDWEQIELLYRRLHVLRPTPVVALNHAAAVGEHRGPAAALAMLDDGLADSLDTYPHFHSTRAEFLRRLGHHQAASDAYRRALAHTAHEPDRRFLRRRLDELAR